MGHGGARQGAGRKRNSEKYGTQVSSFHDRVAADLDKRYNALDMLARGGYEQVEEEWLPAGLVFVDDVEPTDDGRVVKIKRLAFPDKPADELVLVRKRISIAAPDRGANIYLIDRLAGRPAQTVEAEVDVTTPDLTAEDKRAAEREMNEWRKQMSEQLSSMQSALLMPPTSATST